MRARWLPLVAILASLTLESCSTRSSDIAASGALTHEVTPIGPIPGPGTAPALPVNRYQDDPAALADGRRLFLWYNCAGCHGSHAGGGMGPSLRDGDWIYGGTGAHIFDSIAHGRANGMPSWGTKLPADDIWKIAAYVKSLRTPAEPQPPPVTRQVQEFQ